MAQNQDLNYAELSAFPSNHFEKLPKSLYGYSIALMLKDAGIDQKIVENYRSFGSDAASKMPSINHPNLDIDSAREPQNVLILFIAAGCALAQFVILYAVNATTAEFAAHSGFCNEMWVFSIMTVLAFFYANAQTADDIFSELTVLWAVRIKGSVSYYGKVIAAAFICVELSVCVLVLYMLEPDTCLQPVDPATSSRQ